MLQNIPAIIRASSDLVAVLDRHPAGGAYFLVIGVLALAALLVSRRGGR